MKTMILIGLISSSCVVEGEKETKDLGGLLNNTATIPVGVIKGANGDDIEDAIASGQLVRNDQSIVAVSITRSPAVKNYNQVNKTFSNLTGISTGHEDISDEFNAIKTQLPAQNDPTAYNAFSQIATVRLASAYCDIFIDDNSLNINFGSASNQDIANALSGKFLDAPIAQLDPSGQFESTLMSILNNDQFSYDEGRSVSSLAPGASKQNLAKLACVAILSSGYITMI